MCIDLKLPIELVPSSCWYTNVRNNVTRSQWDKIRKMIYQRARYRCEICGGIGKRHPVECHEVWIYDDNTYIQKLSHFEALCPRCHEVKHFGFTTTRGFRDRALNQFCLVNNLNLSEAENIIESFYEQWERRNDIQWELDISLLKSFNIL